MLKKVISVVAILVLIVGGLVIYEHVFAPEPAHASTTTVTPLFGNAVYLNDGVITETKVAGEGDIVKTGDDSKALITFADGSTMELEPNTEVSITEIADTSLSVEQTIGRTWSRFESAVGPNSEFNIETPAAAAVVRGTLVDTLVEEISDTIAALEGVIEVTAQGVTQMVQAGMQSTINRGEAPEEPTPIPPAKNKLRFTIDGPAWGLVVDPYGSSVGVVPPGIPTTQILRATTTGAQSEPQSIVVPVTDEEGEYKYFIDLFGKEVGDVNVEVTGFADGGDVFTETVDVSVEPYEKSKVGNETEEIKYVAELIVTVNADGLITSGELGDFALKKSEGPGQVEIKDWATEGAGEVISPKANFSVEVVGQAVLFTNLSTGDITSYLWDFGDGSTSEEMNPSPHTYIEGGGYSVSLTVTGPEVEGVALQDKMLKEIYVLIVE